MTTPRPAELTRVVARAGRVGVLMGGRSAEREVSLKSGQAVAAALSAAGVVCEALDWDGTLDSLLAWRAFDRFFIALHGRGGEDGTVQAALDLMRKPYTGTRTAGCALAMDKYRAKLAWLGAGLPTPPYLVLTPELEACAAAAALELPFIVKPAHEGSSIGVSKVKTLAEFAPALALARRYDTLALAERWIDGQEYTVGILGTRALPAIRLETPHDIYDYAAKYHDDTTTYICPCGLDSAGEERLANLALEAFATLDGSGWGRVDFMCERDGTPWLIELNTVPGMTDHSLVPMAARQAGMDFPTLTLAILASSMKEDI